jgi:serine/threonine protein kinase
MIEADKVLQNRYRIKKQIGQGGMGAVYVATDERFGSTVAIKETLFADANFSKAFEREARLLNNLRHPALPRVSDHFSDENGQFLVMEYITGEDLSERMEKKDGAFLLKDVLNWADQLLDALDYLHTQEMPVVHRDIKPQNLKLTPRGQIILLDFGLAKGNPTDAQHQTAAKSVFGYSRNYASIEQMQGTGTDPRSDLYSLGATLYHLLTGVPPIDALTRAMQVLNGDQDPLPLANTVHNQVPAAVAEVLQRAMALNSNHRPTSALAMRTMLAESANLTSENVYDSSSAPTFSTGLLTQNTEVFESNPQSKDTQQVANKTEMMPVENSASFPAPTEAARVSLFEDETSVKTRMEEEKRNNIQIPISPKTAANIQPHNQQTNSKGSKRGLVVGVAALGGLLLVGGALGGFYMLNPSASGVSISNVTIVNKEAGNETVGGSTTVNSSDSDILANTSTNTNLTENIKVKKETTDKTTAEVSTPKTVTPTKEVPKTEESQPNKTETKVVVTDKEGNQILEDGTVRSKDGTVVHPDGKVMKDGKVIVNPNPKIQVRPVPPDVKIPPLTREQLEKLTPAQRRKLRQIMENQRRQRENRPHPTPSPNQ